MTGCGAYRMVADMERRLLDGTTLYSGSRVSSWTGLNRAGPSVDAEGAADSRNRPADRQDRDRGMGVRGEGRCAQPWVGDGQSGFSEFYVTKIWDQTQSPPVTNRCG